MRGVDPDERLIFAPRIAQAEHLARHRLADLFLDTLPCSSGTAASDALWAGLPVLTCRGTTFAGRIAASQLRCLGLNELVTSSLPEYAALAQWLAEDRDILGEIKKRLAENRTTLPLFDTDLMRRNIEEAYKAMWVRRQIGQSPEGFDVEASLPPSPSPAPAGAAAADNAAAPASPLGGDAAAPSDAAPPAGADAPDPHDAAAPTGSNAPT
jgi:hypothetical protein